MESSQCEVAQRTLSTVLARRMNTTIPNPPPPSLVRKPVRFDWFLDRQSGWYGLHLRMRNRTWSLVLRLDPMAL